MTYSPLLIFHIALGTISLLSGAAALIYRKGSPWHKKSGLVFVASMFAMTTSGAILAYLKPANIAVIAGVLTFYCVATSLMVIRRRPKQTGALDVIALLVVTGLCLAATYYGNLAAASETGFIQGIEIPVEAYYFFAIISGVCALSDLRYVLIGGLSGAQRIARHLWRMGFAMYMATSSLFTGQPQRFPNFLRESGMLAVPENLVVLLILFWFLKTLVWTHIKKAFNSFRNVQSEG